MTQASTVGPRDIPDPIKRAVRQRCGFGCVLCGIPLYEYDHLLGWANVHRHVAEEIALLCDRHHRERTSGLLPDADVAAANADPFNLRAGVTAAYDLHYSGPECTVALGDNVFTQQDQGYDTVLVPIVIDGLAPIVFTMADGHLLLTVTLFDQFNRPSLHIHQNQLMYTTDHWDVEFAGRELVIRAAQGDVFIDLTFAPPNRVNFTGGRLLYNGVELLLGEDYLWLSNGQNLLSGCTFEGSFGFVIGSQDPPAGCAFRLQNVSRYLGKSPRAGRMAARRAIADAQRRSQEAEHLIQALRAQGHASQSDPDA